MRTITKLSGLILASFFLLAACDEPGTDGGGTPPTETPAAD